MSREIDVISITITPKALALVAVFWVCIALIVGVTLMARPAPPEPTALDRLEAAMENWREANENLRIIQDQ